MDGHRLDECVRAVGDDQKTMQGGIPMNSRQHLSAFDGILPRSTTRRGALRLGASGLALTSGLMLGGRHIRAQATPAPSLEAFPTPLDAWAAGWTALEAAQLAPLY